MRLRIGGMIEMRGEGTIYRQKDSRCWWIQFYQNGKCHRRSSGTEDRRQALKLLKLKIAEITVDPFAAQRDARLTVGQLYESLERDYVINGRKSLIDLQSGWKNHLREYFTALAAASIDSDRVTIYIAQRQKEGAANASINRELSALKRMYTLGIKAQKLATRPYIPMLKESNVRKGFVKDAQYDALARATATSGLWLRAMFEMAYSYGWRKTELLGLRVSQVDFSERNIVLNAGETKNDEPRLVPMTNKVYELLRECAAGKSPEDFVFTRERDRSGRLVKTGGRIVDFRDDWKAACLTAGCPGVLFHDLRRSGVRNLRRSGVTEKVAMKISGHKTRSVFDRYNIVDGADLREAVRKLDRAAHDRRQQDLFEQGEMFPAEAGQRKPPISEPETGAENHHSSDIVAASGKPN